ncbi:MAG: S-layer homology domain-containing protein, partial [Clostridia bacterium]|nr:S-layer homology domain-containing protein [Clostridia bacterium]
MKLTKLLSAALAALMLIGVCMTGVTAKDTIPFTDVPEGEWYTSAVKYVYGKGLMNGTGDGTKFSPTMNLTRGMVVTVLYRNDTSTKGTYINPFVDVKADAYYTTAAAWAYEEGIVSGTGEDEWGDPLFSPERNITRQELAAMFARYAAFKHVDTTKNTTDITSFSDSGKVASWAEKEFKWSAGTGIITGKQNGSSVTLSPTDLATRAEFAIMIERYNVKDAAREFTYFLAYEEPQLKSTFTEPVLEPCDDADIFVAVDGDNNNPGTKEKPLATFEAAKAKARELKNGRDEIVVAFMAGNYGPLDNITFTAEDSGTENARITYRAYGDGDVIFQNGYSLPESMFMPLEESDKALFDDDAEASIKKIDLSGIADDENFNLNALFSGNGICHEARYPNKRANGTDDFYSNLTTTVDKYSSIMLQGPLPSVVESFRTTEGMKVTGFLRVGWLIETFDVKSYDPETNIITFNTYEGFVPPSGYPIGESAGGFDFMYEGRTEDTVYFSNLADQLDSKDEYWFDPETKVLYVYDPHGTYTIATGGAFMALNNANYITFEGLTFNASKADIAFSGTNSYYVNIDACTFSNFAGDRVMNFHMCRNMKFTRNEMFNFGATGIYLTPYWKDRINDFENSFFALKDCGIEIDNNYFHDFGFIDMWSDAINIYCSSGIKVTHNYFKNGAHAAVEFNSANYTVIEYNVFDNMMMTTADYGAVYTNWGFEDRGNIIRYNLFKNMRAAGAQYCIYLDGDSAGVEIYGNLFYDSGACG